MKKSSFMGMVLGTISGVFFALGMCMVLIPEWKTFQPGALCGSIGLLLGIITVMIWRKMEHKPPIQISGKNALIISISIIGALALGIGMCFSMVWDNMVQGILIGVIGLICFISIIPLTKGIKE